MKKLVEKSSDVILKLYVCICTLFISTTAANAADGGKGLGGIADNIRGHFDSIGQAAGVGFALGGFFLVGMGLFQLHQAVKRQEGKGAALAALFIGGILLGVSVMAGVLGETVFGDQSGLHNFNSTK